jgi:two-component system nitrogen regulation sensor histidine kinase GlnL
MNSATTPILVALVAQLGLGLAVFVANPHRKSNQCFLLLSLVLTGWLGSLYGAFTTTDSAVAAIWIREASVAGALIMAFLNLLRLTIRWRKESWVGILRRSWIWTVATIGTVLLCQTRFFLEGARMPLHIDGGGAMPAPIYGFAVYLYTAYMIGAIIALIIGSSRDLRQISGGEHAELAFLLVGAVSIIIGSLLLTFVLERFFRDWLIWVAPIRIILFSLVVAYAIASRKVMEVGTFLRRGIAYAVLTSYLLGLYGFVWWLMLTATREKQLAQVVAAIVVAFAMAPARGISQSFADRLVIGTRRLDFQSTMNEAAGILKSVATLPDLLERFAKTIAGAVATDSIFILLPNQHGFAQLYPRQAPELNGSSLLLSKEEAIIKYLETNQQPLVLHELYRVRQTPELEVVEKQMKSLRIAVAMGIFSREHLAGVMLLGPRLSGRIYGSVEQNALRVLCGQLAIAIDNAQLFTEVQNARIYNETLLQNLTTGVIAADADGSITVFNNEAGQIIGLSSEEMLGRSIDVLPVSLSELARETLRSNELVENRELALDAAEDSVVVRASSSTFHGQEGEMLGVLVVLTDVTALKHLEQQIRRSDRLASLGTLSAGMAHEIKNPLVSIKTFAQLLPERYQDSDFRETFSNLIGHEIDRIDSLVNQLLRFARPAKPLLKPIHIHSVLEKSLQLIGHRLYQKEIKLTRLWRANVDTIRADADQLEQVFLNFFLNAMDSMKQKHGSELEVSTEIRPGEELVASGNNGGTHEALRISIRDTGEGIRSEDLSHVFDPFFTTKDYGTGLGLSVAHGIVQEHCGQIEVESELGKGTTFRILLPLVRFEQEALAAT